MWLRVDGRPVPAGAPAIPADDLGLLLGWTAFETLVAHEGAPVDIERHLARLQASCEALLLTPHTFEAWCEDVAHTLTDSGLSEARVRLTLTAGGHRICAVSALDASRWGAAVTAVRVPAPVELIPVGAKHGSRAGSAVALRRAGVDELLLVDGDGRFTEGTASAIVAVIDGVVWTRAEGVLPSTTVARLCHEAARLGIAVVRQGPPASGPWEGLYIASVTRGLAPVVRLDGADRPGDEPVGRAVRDALRASCTAADTRGRP